MSTITNAGPPVTSLWAWVVVDTDGQEALCRSPWNEAAALVGPDAGAICTPAMRQWCESYYEGRTVKIVRFESGATRWEVRARHGPVTVSSSPPNEAEAREEYERELRGLDPSNRAELVRVIEVLEESHGPGEPIDPWDGVKLPFIPPKDRRPRLTFAERLARACEANAEAPEPFRRPRWVKQRWEARFEVSISLDLLDAWFTGEATPARPDADRLAELLEVDCQWLAGGEL